MINQNFAFFSSPSNHATLCSQIVNVKLFSIVLKEKTSLAQVIKCLRWLL